MTGIKDEVMIVVNQMDALLERRANLIKLVAQQEEDITEIETAVAGSVANNAELTNDTKRKAETLKQLAGNADYQQKKHINQSTKNELMECESDIEKKRFRMKGYEIITRPLW